MTSFSSVNVCNLPDRLIYFPALTTIVVISYKQRCPSCRKAMVLVTIRSRNPFCYNCQKDQLKGKIKDPEMKQMFAIPEELYVNNAFLRSIKINYLRFGSLTPKQVDAFKKAVTDLSGTAGVQEVSLPKPWTNKISEE